MNFKRTMEFQNHCRLCASGLPKQVLKSSEIDGRTPWQSLIWQLTPKSPCRQQESVGRRNLAWQHSQTSARSVKTFLGTRRAGQFCQFCWGRAWLCSRSAPCSLTTPSSALQPTSGPWDTAACAGMPQSGEGILHRILWECGLVVFLAGMDPSPPNVM